MYTLFSLDTSFDLKVMIPELMMPYPKMLVWVKLCTYNWMMTS